MKKTGRMLLYSVVLLVILALLLPGMGIAGTKVTGALLLGWLSFLRRVLPEVVTNWSGIGMVVVCSALIIAGTHWLCGWIYAYNAPGEERRWRRRWSLSLYAALWLLFIAAMGITGFVHQLAWLISSKEPILVERRPRAMSLVRETAMQLIQAGEGAAWDLAATRKDFFAEMGRFSERRQQPLEELHVLFLPGPEEKLAAAIIFPRDRAEQEKTGFTVILDKTGGSEEQHPMKDLPDILARLSTK